MSKARPGMHTCILRFLSNVDSVQNYTVAVLWYHNDGCRFPTLHQHLCNNSVIWYSLLMYTYFCCHHHLLPRGLILKMFIISDWSLCVCSMLVAPVGVSSLSDTPQAPPPSHQPIGMKKSASDSQVVSGDHTPNSRRSSNPILGSSKQKVRFWCRIV